MEFIEQIYGFLMSPWGGIAPSAFFGITIQLWSYKGLMLSKATGKQADLFISEGIGYLVTILVALLLYFKVNKDIMIFLINSGGGFACHIVFARWIDPWLKRKGKGKQ